MITKVQANEIRNEIIAKEMEEQMEKVENFCETEVEQKIREALKSKRFSTYVTIPSNLVTLKNGIIDYIVRNGGFQVTSNCVDTICVSWEN